jgi:hypothetical protein
LIPISGTTHNSVSLLPPNQNPPPFPFPSPRFSFCPSITSNVYDKTKEIRRTERAGGEKERKKERARTPHERPHARNEIYELPLDAHVLSLRAEPGVLQRGGPADAREEAVFAEDRDGVYEEDGDFFLVRLR